MQHSCKEITMASNKTLKIDVTVPGEMTEQEAKDIFAAALKSRASRQEYQKKKNAELQEFRAYKASKAAKS